jgi:hypothetical protein
MRSGCMDSNTSSTIEPTWIILHGDNHTQDAVVRFLHPTRRYQTHPPPRRIAVQAGAQILTHRQPSRVSRSGAGVWGAVALHEGAGSRGEGLGSPLAPVQGRAGPVDQPHRRCKKKMPRRQAQEKSA